MSSAPRLDSGTSIPAKIYTWRNEIWLGLCTDTIKNVSCLRTQRQRRGRTWVSLSVHAPLNPRFSIHKELMMDVRRKERWKCKRNGVSAFIDMGLGLAHGPVAHGPSSFRLWERLSPISLYLAKYEGYIVETCWDYTRIIRNVLTEITKNLVPRLKRRIKNQKNQIIH
jgi:hypothetical protein